MSIKAIRKPGSTDPDDFYDIYESYTALAEDGITVVNVLNHTGKHQIQKLKDENDLLQAQINANKDKINAIKAAKGIT